MHVLILTVILGIIIPALGFAQQNPPELGNLAIPAATCQIASLDPGVSAQLNASGFWHSGVGTTHLVCPLPIREAGRVRFFRISHYLEVEVTLIKNFGIDQERVCSWKSRTETPLDRGELGPDSAISKVACDTHLEPGFHVFEVRLTSDDPGFPHSGFMGIDFADDPFPSEALSCDHLFSSVPGYRLCGADENSCTFNANTNKQNCNQICASMGASCLGAFDNHGDSCEVIAGSQDTCSTIRQTELCQCERL